MKCFLIMANETYPISNIDYKALKLVFIPFILTISFLLLIVLLRISLSVMLLSTVILLKAPPATFLEYITKLLDQLTELLIIPDLILVLKCIFYLIPNQMKEQHKMHKEELLTVKK